MYALLKGCSDMTNFKISKHKILFYDSRNGNSGPMDRQLINAGYLPLHADNETKALKLARRERPVAIFINLDSCGSRGFETCRKIKSDDECNGAVLFVISLDDSETEIVRAFQSGADNFLPMLHGPRELLARLRALKRWNNIAESRKVKVKDIEIDLSEQRVFKAGHPLQLTYIQFKLLCLLINQRNKIFTRKEILDKVWENNRSVTSRTVDVHIKRLREKLGEVKYPSHYIETIHGAGYQFLK
jgi:two-component system alkaline phosphatase synthesis response regulator PhoP